MDNISTITELLEVTGARLRFFDMGRRVSKISRQQFLQFEKTEIPYPYPLKQQAWFAMLFQDAENNGEPFIWFLRFPLDEQGKLLQAARDDFMHRLVERLGENLEAQKRGEQVEAALQDNPYSFKPKEDKMAVFHAKASRLLQQQPSGFYREAKDYFAGKTGWEAWTNIGLQGIADVAARLDQDDNEQHLVSAIAQLPEPPLVALCHCLENESISLPLTETLLDRAGKELDQPQPNLGILAALLRGASQSKSETVHKQLLHLLLNSQVGNHIELLAALSGRGWECLSNWADVRQQFLERLADNNAGQEAFNQCMADLLFMPGMRPAILASVRDPERSEKLSSAIGTLFQSVAEETAPQAGKTLH